MAKAKKVKIPKRIAGVKLPKELRRKGDALLEKANSPAGREVIAAGLAVAAAAAGAALERQRGKQAAQAASNPDATAARSDATPCGDERVQGVQNPQALADALGATAEMVMGRLFGARKA